ncbi:MAG TPA: glycosyltransferase [Polyangia bacterium]|nr:glycosyltransferase [Polyangia bacterium]
MSLRALLVDPSLFTAPYDAALTEGLLASGTEPVWAVRPTRPGDRAELPPGLADPMFYRRVDQMSGLPPALRAVAKGIAHLWGLVRLVVRVARQRPDVVHFQWLVVPPLDLLAMMVIRRRAVLVLTVHDTVPFNGDRPSRLQTAALSRALRLCDVLIVHTADARQRLIARGVPASRLAVVPHGPLALTVPVPAQPEPPAEPSVRRFTLFGELKPYKGIDVLLQAVAALPPALRSRARFVVAGRARMDLEPIQRQIEALGLDGLVELRPRRLTEPEMADLFAATDCFVFPYRQVDASGVYYLTKALGKWMIASRVGVFAEDLADGSRGTLVDPEAPAELARALAAAIESPRRPAAYAPAGEWIGIGAATASLYRQALAGRATAAVPAGRGAPRPAGVVSE